MNGAGEEVHGLLHKHSGGETFRPGKAGVVRKGRAQLSGDVPDVPVLESLILRGEGFRAACGEHGISGIDRVQQTGCFRPIGEMVRTRMPHADKQLVFAGLQKRGQLQSVVDFVFGIIRVLPAVYEFVVQIDGVVAVTAEFQPNRYIDRCSKSVFEIGIDIHCVRTGGKPEPVSVLEHKITAFRFFFHYNWKVSARQDHTAAEACFFV